MRKCKKEKTIWFANYTTTEVHCGRTTELKLFDKLKDAHAFMSDKYGYIIRQTDNGWRQDMGMNHVQNVLVGYYNGFVPSPTEAAGIKQLTYIRGE